METVLSAAVFVYAIKGVAEIINDDCDFGWIALWINVVLCTGCVVWTWLSHSICMFKAQGAVNKIKSIHEGEIDRLGCSRRAGSRGLDGIDLFEYHDVITISLNVSKVISLWLLFVFFWLGVLLLLVICLVLFPFNVFSGVGSDFACTLSVSLCLWFVCYTRLIFSRGVIGRIVTFGEAFRFQPFHVDVRALLLVSSMVYSLLLFFSPVPPMWRWSLITMRTIRTLKVWASLRGQNEGVMEARGEVAGDML